MTWSKVKQRIEAGFADSVRGRVEVWTTSYRGAHDRAGESWITVDKVLVHSMGTISYYIAENERSAALIAGGMSSAVAREVARRELGSVGVLADWDFKGALGVYLDLSIDAVLASDVMIIRALGMFDKRLGKRRLRSLDLRHDHDMVQRFHRMRCDAEGIGLTGRPGDVTPRSSLR
jgi:hypothetical protein